MCTDLQSLLDSQHQHLRGLGLMLASAAKQVYDDNNPVAKETNVQVTLVCFTKRTAVR